MRLSLCAVLVATMLCACGSAEPPAQIGPARRACDPTTSFLYHPVVGSEFSSRTTRGRVTTVLFVTTFDMASQVVAKRLDKLRRKYARLAAGAVVLEAPEHRVLAEAFHSSLKLSYPIAMAGKNASKSPFGEIDGVPTLIVLDQRGCEVWRRVGLPEEEEMEAAITTAIAE